VPDDADGRQHRAAYSHRVAARHRAVHGADRGGLLNAVVAEDLPGPGSVFLRVAWNFLAPVRPGDEITAEVEVLEVHATKPVFRIRTTITNGDGVVVLDGDAHVYRVPVGRSSA
jgi:acyl dehydratase